MRLIDADMCMEKIKDMPITYDAETVQRCIEVLSNAPTIDAEPVRHGKWIDETFKPWGLVHHPFKCNLCGEHAEFASPYCPNCGARMDEE